MFLFRKPSPYLINFFLFIFFYGLTYSCSGNIPGTSCFPNHYVVSHNCRCFDNSFDGSKVALQPHTYTSWNLKLWKLVLYFGRGNAIATGFTIVIVLLNIVVYKLRQQQEGSLGEKNKPLDVSSGLFCRRFSFAEIELATNNFDEEFIIGKGGFGKVYKGLIDRGESTVAIKRLDSKSKQGASEFWTEINMLSSFRHCHLVSLIGYCNEFQEMTLVYEYMPNGSLNDHLHKVGRSNSDFPLSWVQRLKICIGAARALDYLHTGTGLQYRVIHRDVKSSNILLDKNWGAKISDFGVAKIGAADQPCTHVSTEVKGSFGYFDPHYFMTRKLTRKSDVYAFGVVLFEVLCGRPAVDLTLEEDQQSLSRWAQHCVKEGMSGQIIDPSLTGQIAPGCLMTIVQIADQCLENLPKKRPTMAEVVVKLESALAMQERNDSSSSVRHHEEPKRSGNTGSRLFSMKSDRTTTFSMMLRHFFSVKTRLSSVQGNAKLSRKKKSNSKSILDCVFPSKKLVSNKDGGVSEDLPSSEQIATLKVKVFTLAELKSSTMNFSQDMVLGMGGYGTVFMGWVDKNTCAPSKVGVGMPIAVKKCNTDGFQGHTEWQMEVKILGRLRHSHLVKLLGFCQEEKELLLVYEYMQKGSLENYLFRNGLIDPLPWTILLKIMIGAARGLAFLHQNQVIFRDFKSDNILLDQDFNAKMTDFGLAKNYAIHGEAHVSTCVMGTWGYAAPEYIATGHLTVKNDVYGFGVVLLEILTGRRVIDKTRPYGEQNLVDWAGSLLPKKRKLKKIMNPSLVHDCPPEGAFQFALLILKCLQSEPRKRPEMEEVLMNLEQISAIKMTPESIHTKTQRTAQDTTVITTQNIETDIIELD